MFSWLFGNKDKARKFYEQAKELEKQAKIFKENKKKSKECYETALYCINEAIRLNPEYATMPQIHAFKGVLDYSNNNIELALHDFKMAIKLDPQNPDYHGDIAQIYLDLGEYDAAHLNVRFALRLNPLRIEFKKLLNEIEQKIIKSQTSTHKEVSSQENIKQNSKNKTEADLDKNSNNQISGKSAKEYYEEGRVYLNAKSYDNAFECFKKAVELEPNKADYYYWCGISKYENNKFDIAEQYFSMAINKKPLSKYYYFRGHSKYNNGAYQNAINDLEIGLQKNPKDSYRYYNTIADVKRKMGDLEGAVGNYKFALEYNPPKTEREKIQKKIDETEKQLTEKYFLTGKKYYEEEDYEQAIEYFEKAIDIDANNASYLYQCGLAKYWNNQDDDAIKYFDKAIAINSQNPNYYYFRGHSKYFSKRYEDAIEDYKIGINKNPDDIYEYYELIADAKDELGNLEDAIANYEKSLENNPSQEKCHEIAEKIEDLKQRVLDKKIESYYEQGCTYRNEGNNEKAIECFEKMIELDPDNPESYYWCGQVKYWNNQDNKAIENLNKAIELCPLAKYYYLRALIKNDMGDYDGVIEDCESAKECDYKEDYSHYDELIEEAKSAKKSLEEDEELNNNDIYNEEVEYIDPIEKIQSRASELYNKAINEFNQNEYKSAILNIEKAIKWNDANPDYYYLYAQILNQIKEPDRALKQLQKAININNKPEYFEFRKIIEKTRSDYIENVEIETQKVEYKPCEQNYIYDAEPDKSFLVNAGPGTGKTYTLIQKIKHLIDKTKDEDEENKIKEKNILVLSHTNAAVDEIKDRLKNISNDTNIRVNKINIRTICSFVKLANTKYYEAYNRDKNEREKKYYVYEVTDSGFIKANNNLLDTLKADKNSLKTLLQEELKIKYLIVDEIQDAVDSVGEIICKLVEACIKLNISLALFGDKCQAIFDFDKNNDEYKLKSTEFYEQIENKLKNKNNMHFVSLDKNMRQQDGLINYENFKEDLAKYREAVSNNDIKTCKECLKNIKDNTSNDLTIANDDNLKNLTHCILTHSNSRALYIASILRKKGIPVYARINGNEIQFEYNEWIGKIFNFRCSHLSFKKFNELVNECNIALPTNYKGYDSENHTKSFYEYLNKEVLKQEPNYKIDKQELLRKICGEYTNDSIFKKVEKHNIEVSTIHKAKGREFDFVHIESGCCEDNPGYKKKLFEDKPDTYKSMYVALTRAKKFIDIVEFKSLPESYNLQDDRYYIKVTKKSKIKEYKILYKDIDLDSFRHYQKELQEIKINDKIILIKNDNNQWDIMCNHIVIGQMKTISDPYKSKNEMKQITGLRIDGIWSVFGKNKNTGNIDVWNVVSFCGFGDVKYE